MPRVDVPEHNAIIDFPDDLPKDEMLSAIHKKFYPERMVSKPPSIMTSYAEPGYQPPSPEKIAQATKMAGETFGGILRDLFNLQVRKPIEGAMQEAYEGKYATGTYDPSQALEATGLGIVGGAPGRPTKVPGTVDIGLLAGSKAMKRPRGVGRGLSDAAEMAGKGADVETIWQKTGWIKGKEGKWRFEINDKDMKMSDLFDKSLRESTQTGYEMKGKLSEFIDHPGLFEQYPHMKDMEVVISPFVDHPSFQPTTNSILIPHSGFKDVKSSMIHEIQHVIQEYEGLAKGGSPEIFRTGWRMSEGDYKALQDEAFNKYRVVELFDKAGKKGITAKQALAEESKLWGLDTGNDRIRKLLDITRSKEEATRLWKEDKARLDKYKTENFIEPDKAYRSLYGEFEARDAASRMDFTSEQRQTVRPYSSEMEPEGGWIVK